MKEYITGRNVIISEGYSGYDEWECENALIKSLMNSMTPHIMSHFV